MRKLKNHFRGAVAPLMTAAAVAALILGGQMMPARSQPVPSNVGPYNVDLGAVITNTAQAAGDLASAPQPNIDQNGVVCTYLPSAQGGFAMITFSIQGFDTATNTWHTMVTSPIVAALPTLPNSVGTYPGAQTSSLPTGYTYAGLPLPRIWRVSETVGGGSTPTITAKIGCVIQK